MMIGIGTDDKAPSASFRRTGLMRKKTTLIVKNEKQKVMPVTIHE